MQSTIETEGAGCLADLQGPHTPRRKRTEAKSISDLRRPCHCRLACLAARQSAARRKTGASRVASDGSGVWMRRSRVIGLVCLAGASPLRGTGNLRLASSHRESSLLCAGYGNADRRSQRYDDMATEKQSRSISRLYLTGNRKASSKSHFGSEVGSPKKSDDMADPKVLRKRTSSQAEVPVIPGLSTEFKAGQSVLEQIGSPDHNGWLRKKGEHYNTWKLRYFVLKGPHLYYLRSNSKTVRRRSRPLHSAF